MQIFTSEALYQLWAKGKNIIYKNKTYRVGKMSYGDYFFEPGVPRGETKPFNKGTLWLERIERKGIIRKGYENVFVPRLN